MSRHATNAAVAVANHRVWFGDPDGVEYRASDGCTWATIPYAVCHGEQVAFERRSAPNGTQTSVKRIRRTVYVDRSNLPEGLKLHAHIRIGGECGTVYTVIEMMDKTNRVALTCQRGDVAEVTRPGYRGPLGGA